MESDASSVNHRPRRTPSLTASSVISIDDNAQPSAPPSYATVSPPSNAVRTLDVPPIALTERELNAVLTTQVVWLADLVRTHVPQLPPDDLADEAGRRLMQARGQWLVTVPNPMEVPLHQLLRLLYPVWHHLLRRYSS